MERCFGVVVNGVFINPKISGDSSPFSIPCSAMHFQEESTMCIQNTHSSTVITGHKLPPLMENECNLHLILAKQVPNLIKCIIASQEGLAPFIHDDTLITVVHDQEYD